MCRRNTLTVLIGCAALAAGCGGDDSTTRTEEKKPVSIAARQAQLEENPYDLRCDDIRATGASAHLTRTVQYALAEDAKIKGLNPLQASQSIYYAITELCKSQPGSYQPAKDAIAGVRSGEFRVQL